MNTIEKFRKPLALAAITIGMLASASDILASPVQHAFGVNRELVIPKPLPLDLKKLITEVSKDDPTASGVTNLLNAKYIELGKFKVGKSNIRIVQVGGELDNGALTTSDIQTTKRELQLFSSFAGKKDKLNPEIGRIKLGFDGKRYLTKERLGLDIRQRRPQTDRVVFMVPSRVDIGLDGSGLPIAFTDLDSSKVASFVRPDLRATTSEGIDLNGIESVAVEMCQSMVSVTLPEAKQTSKVESTNLRILGQEIICNGLGRALFHRLTGSDFKSYQYAELDRKYFYTPNPPSAKYDAFVASIPNINSKAVYNRFNRVIPTNSSRYLSFSKISKQLISG